MHAFFSLKYPSNECPLLNEGFEICSQVFLLDTLESNVNAELTNISDWLIANKLSLNTKRSNYLIFSQKNKRINQEITKLSNVVL